MTRQDKTHEELFDEFVSESRGRWQSLLGERPSDDPARLESGYFEFAFSLSGNDGDASLRDLRDKVQETQNSNSGAFHTFADSGNRAKPIGYAIETLFPEVDTTVKCRDLRYYWRILNDGRLYGVRGYFEDSGTASAMININSPIVYIGQSLKLAAALIGSQDANSEVKFSGRFTGILHRKLTFQNPERDAFYGNDHICYNSEMNLRPVHTSKEELDKKLGEIVHACLHPFYEQFNYFQLSSELVEQALGATK